jgi:arylformamidase
MGPGNYTDGPVDLTQTVERGMTVYVGDPIPDVSKFKTLEKDGVNVSVLRLGSHTGTHVDAPAHFVPGGKTVDELPVGGLVGEAAVLDFSSKEPGSAILEADLEERSAEVGEGLIVLIYTGFSKRWDDPAAVSNFTYLSGEAAEWLVRKGVKAVGIDYLSVEKFGAESPVAHRALLSNGIPIIESLHENLSRLVGRRVFFVCLPIKVGGWGGGGGRGGGEGIKEEGG